MRQIPLAVRLPDRAVFASFLPGPNAQAFAHAQQLAAAPGAGLDLAVRRRRAPARRICCRRSAPRRARAGAPATCRSRTSPRSEWECSTACRRCRCCASTTSTGWSGRCEWERGVFALLRELEEAGGQLVLSAQSPPALVPWTLADLGSRCAAGDRVPAARPG